MPWTSLHRFVPRRLRVCGSAERGQLSRGFTLFEVLVVLLIVGLVSGVSMSMVSQIRAALDRLYPNAQHFAQLEIRVGMLTRLVGGLVPSRDADTAFKGDATGFSSLGTYFPGDAWPTEQYTTVQVSAQSGEVVVVVSRAKAAQSIDRTELMRLACTQIRFWYLDLELQWRERWQQAKEWPYLPLAVRLSCDSETQPLHVIAAIEREGVAVMSDQPLMLMGR